MTQPQNTLFQETGHGGIRMGYQESFIKFRNAEDLIEEVRKYKRRDTSSDLAELVCVDRVKKAVHPFKAGELVAVVCGERSEQRTTNALREGLGIENVQSITFIDEYMDQADGDLPIFLEEHFEKLSESELEVIIR
jgi:hypothetical protein